MLVLAMVASGCATAEHPPEPTRAAAPAANPWCTALPALTSDPSGDLTGKANTEARVLSVRAAHEVDQVLMRCPGVVSVGMTLAPIAEHMAAGDFSTWAANNLKPAKGDERDWVFTIGTMKPEHMPQKSPL
jgi:hypothetical protein